MIAQYILLSVKTVYIILSTRSKHIKGITETHFRMFLKTDIKTKHILIN